MKRVEMAGGWVVLHKVTGKFTGHCSAWFGPDGTMFDCEWHRRDGQVRLIPPHSPMWRYLAAKGGES